MKSFRYLMVVAAMTVTACNPQPEGEAEGSAPPVDSVPEISEPARAELPPVDPTLLSAPNSAFTAIEPSEVGVFAAPGVMQALDPLLGPEVTEGANVHLTVSETGDQAVADIVRTGLQDDSVSGGHVRIEFRREPEGWFPTNAYRRTQCARGGEAGQWTAGLCP
jgi:hypothetical protein